MRTLHRYIVIYTNMKLEIKSGVRYGKLVTIKEGERVKLPSGQYNRTVICQCDCGTIKSIRLLHLTRGRSLSCGCSCGVLHGDSYTKLYTKWQAIVYRCHESPYVTNYTTKNITVCEEWRNSYLKFKEWSLLNGYDKTLQIDRKDNSKGYSPDNCRFVTGIVNVNNRNNAFMIEYNGVNQS